MKHFLQFWLTGLQRKALADDYTQYDHSVRVTVRHEERSVFAVVPADNASADLSR